MAPQSSSDINQVFRKPPEIRNGLKPVVIYTLYAVELAVHKTFSGASQLGIYFKTRKNIKMASYGASEVTRDPKLIWRDNIYSLFEAGI